ncbi:MAG: MopE-related protein, partial [Myxococcota bacterium]
MAGEVVDSCAPGAAAASDATCDGVDDDCDGMTDEDYAPESTSCGTGACAESGETSCVAGEVVDSCAPGAAAASDATCDGVDDDCDGATDEDYQPESTSCGVGACASTGTTSCEGGEVVDSCAAGTPVEEICLNDLDDDCDGQVDEGCTCPPEALTIVSDADTALMPQGVPAVPTWDEHTAWDDVSAALPDSTWIWNAWHVEEPVAGETQRFRRQFVLPDDVLTAEGTLAFATDNSYRVWVNGALVADSEGANGYMALHSADVGAWLTGGVNVLEVEIVNHPQSFGTVTKNPAGLLYELEVTWTRPVAETGEACPPYTGCCLDDACDESVCDGVDDDCDGMTDEDFAAEPTSCGTGACAATGTLECVGGETVDSCEATAPADEVCDGVDNDCDGATDEGFGVGETCVVDPCGYGTGVDAVLQPCVEAGVVACGAGGEAVCETDGCRLSTVWQLGVFDFGEQARGSATEFPAEDEYTASFDYFVEGAGSASPDMPAYLSDVPLSTIDPYRAPTNGTAELRIHFTLDAPLTGAAVHWSRFGSEVNALYLDVDGAPVTVTSVAEGSNGVYDVPLPDLAAGEHTLTITYGGGGAENGNYLDAIRLVGLDCGEPGAELCGNATDDDCDCEVDEGFDGLGEPCSAGVGACSAEGEMGCSEDGLGLACTAEPGAPTGDDTDCDGVDDDCDGTTDEDYVAQATSCGVGACASTGETSCAGGEVVDSCAPGAAAASDATCDGVDDDCDGATDEDYQPEATSCGEGACASTGETSCAAGEVVDSCEAGSPAGSDATCDGVDDDCDGMTDEDYQPEATSCGVGACASTGETSCAAGEVVDSCEAGSPAGSDATCDGVDDDCDGATDEDYQPEATSCGEGACASTGETSCAAGEVVDSCEAGSPAGSDATCDGVDDDCDGMTDEDYQPEATSCGVGACASTGETSCAGGEVVDSCAPGAAAASDATCDGVDDDCDGATDEDYQPEATSCGEGACASTGETSCAAGEVVDSCEAGSPAGSDATCDGVDDDCDGMTDEDYQPEATSCGVGACASTGETSCAAGEVVDSCEAGSPAGSDATCDG